MSFLPPRLPDDPLAAAGLRLVHFRHIGTRVVTMDGYCICTAADRCADVDRRLPGGEQPATRCSLKMLRDLESQAACRHAYQSGE